MGFRSKWIAVPEAARDAALAATGLRSRGKTTRELETGWYGLRLGGRYLVIASGWDHMDRLTEGHAVELSAHGEAVFWQADDTTMCSRIALHRDRALAWAFTHCEETPAALEGDAPESVRALLAEQHARQQGESNVDFVYDVAHLAGDRLLGFRHDVFEAPGGGSFEVLRPVEAPPPEVQRRGPFAVHLELEPDGCSAEVEALEAVEVRRALVLAFEDGEISGVVEHAGRALARGERFTVWAPKDQWALVITLADGRELEFRPSSGGVARFFKRLFSRGQ